MGDCANADVLSWPVSLPAFFENDDDPASEEALDAIPVDTGGSDE